MEIANHSTPIKSEEPRIDKEIEKNPIVNNVNRKLPCWNCKEKIIIIIDRSEDDNCTHFRTCDGNLSPLAMLKHCLKFYVRTKNTIDTKHEFAIITLNENNAAWLLDFTNNIKKIINCLENIKNCEPEDVFDLNTIFDVIMEHVRIPSLEEIDNLPMPPPFVVRSVLLYGRSYTIPKLEDTQDINKLLNTPFFTLDVVMTHEPEDVDNNCTKIYKVLQNIDRKGFAYFFSVERNSKKLHNSLMVLLSHVLQRPIQDSVDYNIKDD